VDRKAILAETLPIGQGPLASTATAKIMTIGQRPPADKPGQISCDETMPSRRTVFQWLAKHSEFADLYATAREAQIDGLLGETVEIADTDPKR
jgi:hypothetical protein